MTHRGNGWRRFDMDNIDLTKKLVQLGTCGHEMIGTPLYLVGKIETCYACYYKAQQEARAEQPARLPFDRDDAEILAAARKVSPEAVLTSGQLSQMVHGDAQEADWMTEAIADHAEFVDVKFGSKKWFDNVEEIPF